MSDTKSKVTAKGSVGLNSSNGTTSMIINVPQFGILAGNFDGGSVDYSSLDVVLTTAEKHTSMIQDSFKVPLRMTASNNPTFKVTMYDPEKPEDPIATVAATQAIPGADSLGQGFVARRTS